MFDHFTIILSTLHSSEIQLNFTLVIKHCQCPIKQWSCPTVAEQTVVFYYYVYYYDLPCWLLSNGTDSLAVLE